MPRTGLRIIAKQGVHDDVRIAVKYLAVWLRLKFRFPIRVPIYLTGGDFIKNKSGVPVSAKFFGPYSLEDEPYITVSTGLYLQEKEKTGTNDALAGILCSVIHEILHYQQWINDEAMTESGIDDASGDLLDEYATDVGDPLEPRSCP